LAAAATSNRLRIEKMQVSPSTVTREKFGETPDGSAIELVRLRGDHGFEARIITFGAALQALFVPDRMGQVADVVLGRDDLAGYLAVRKMLGSTVGRYANRIANGTFEIDGQRYQLATHDGANALHGGPLGFDRKVWTISATGEEPAPFVTMSYVSADGEEGYPGTLRTSVTYRVSGMELSIAFTAEADRPTIVNLTNHSFFNLTGVGGVSGILDHRVMIAADNYLPVRPDGIPLGEPRAVESTPFDFRGAHPVGERLADADEQIRIRGGYDHCYCLPGGLVGEPRFAARVDDPASGRAMELWTDQSGVQFYSGNFLDGSVTGKYGRAHRKFDALCLEPQTWPDAPNRPAFPSPRLDPGQTYRHTSLYRFSTG
jgi:aldose 1-epimerase